MKEGRQVVGREEFLSDRRPDIISAVTPCLTGCCSVPTPRSTVLSVDNPPSLQLNRFAMTADASTQPTDTAATSKVSASSPPGKQARRSRRPSMLPSPRLHHTWRTSTSPRALGRSPQLRRPRSPGVGRTCSCWCCSVFGDSVAGNGIAFPCLVRAV
jgi:hypothetical protein